MTSVVASPVVVVTGANGLVGEHVVAALVERGATVRAVVRRPGAAPDLPGAEEHVGDFADAGFAAEVVTGADALVTTVHPLGGDAETQRRVGLDGTMVIASAAADAGVPVLVHVSTAGVYDRSPGAGDVDEDGTLVPDGSDDYGVIKRDVDAALDRLGGPTRVLVRPPAILGAGATSVWNTLRPAQVRDDEAQRHSRPDATFAWVHVDDLAALVAEVATGAIPVSDDPEVGPLAGGCTCVNVAGEPATQRDYLGTVTDALGVDPVWDDGPVWTGRIVADRARRWGWEPRVTLAQALHELSSGVRDLS
ncbi:NAD-dependent epimerase/dehydratase family protein [Nocardioides hwasunensis]|uniref:NAD(P)-dependent oxidoreductase n=1 Tax=Nocardioides hwasunensis TaxID=397258 RepID=A0ABR8MHU1_9ACTN|nr:NAD(P)-dependent oxidoreductase [Nocardioides hwasunensis]MBD3915498.1 NAD(P)-dependent oxidoreductase [Nocardioides hwasunensis]